MIWKVEIYKHTLLSSMYWQHPAAILRVQEAEVDQEELFIVYVSKELR